MLLIIFKRILQATTCLSVLLIPSTTHGKAELLTLSSNPNYDEVVYAQKAGNGALQMGANECFFFPVGPKLITGGKVKNDPQATLFNKGERYEEIAGLQKPGQQVKWPLLPLKKNSFDIEIFMRVSKKDAGARWIVRCGDLQKEVVTVFSTGEKPQPWKLSGKFLQAGQNSASIQYLTLELISPAPQQSSAGIIQNLNLKGPAAASTRLLRSRWRPQAIHTRFTNTQLTEDKTGVMAWIMEVRPHFDFAGDPFQFYAPITTDFGYYGSTFMPTRPSTPDTFTVKPMNFSLWSYKRGADEPPIPQLSHLLAIGDPNRQFGGYHHEGTGVKPRGPLPQIEGRTHDSLVLGMRYDPPQTDAPHPYRTYHSYFLDPANGQWVLYASGRKYADNPSKYETLREPGAFVEVPGRVVSQRTHQSLRSASYRGWLMDSNGQWHPVDSMKGSTRIGEIAPKRWETTDDGWLKLTTGGMVYRRFKTKQNGISYTPRFDLPSYMQPKALKGFAAHPVSIEIDSIEKKNNGDLVIEFELQGSKEDAEVALYYGKEDGLTLIFEDDDQASKWEGNLSKRFPSGKHQWIVPAKNLPSHGFCRLLANTNTGRFWSFESSSW